MKTLRIRPLIGFFAGFPARAFAVAALIAGFSLLVPAAAKAQDLSEIVLRLNQLEGQVRSLSGQVEELQFENRQLRERLQRMQEDVAFRLDELGAGPAPQRSGQNTPPAEDPVPATPQMDAPDAAQPSSEAPLQQAGPGRGDAFDPGRDPLAPGTRSRWVRRSPSAPLRPPRRDPRQWRRRADVAAIQVSRWPAAIAQSRSQLVMPPRQDTAIPHRVQASRPTDDAVIRVPCMNSALRAASARRYDVCRDGFSASSAIHTRDDFLPPQVALNWLGEELSAAGAPIARRS